MFKVSTAIHDQPTYDAALRVKAYWKAQGVTFAARMRAMIREEDRRIEKKGAK